MSHIKDRLSDYHDFMKKLVDDHQMVLASDVLEMIEQLKDDLEQDEKENGWIPVSERLPDIDKIVLVSQTYSLEHFEDGASVTIGRLHQREKNTIPYWEFQYYRPDFKHGTIMDNGIICPGSEYVVAWKPLPDTPHMED